MPETGVFLGELTNEITDEYGQTAYADAFVATGPKSYALKIRIPGVDGLAQTTKHIVKSKSLTINAASADIVNFENMVRLICNDGITLCEEAGVIVKEAEVSKEVDEPMDIDAEIERDLNECLLLGYGSFPEDEEAGEELSNSLIGDVAAPSQEYVQALNQPSTSKDDPLEKYYNSKVSGCLNSDNSMDIDAEIERDLNECLLLGYGSFPEDEESEEEVGEDLSNNGMDPLPTTPNDKMWLEQLQNDRTVHAIQQLLQKNNANRNPEPTSETLAPHTYYYNNLQESDVMNHRDLKYDDDRLRLRAPYSRFQAGKMGGIIHVCGTKLFQVTTKKRYLIPGSFRTVPFGYKGSIEPL